VPLSLKPKEIIMAPSPSTPEIETPAWSEVLATQLLSLFPATAPPTQQTLHRAILQLGRALAQGDTCLLQPSAPQADRDWLDHPLLVAGAQALGHPAPLVIEPAEGEQHYLYLYRHWQQEWQLAERLAALLRPETPPPVVVVDLAYDATPDAAGSVPNPPKLNAQQRVAVARAAAQPFTLITGGPGTGKTFTLVRIVQALLAAQPDLRIALAAPTGKAAQRMQSVLSTEFSRAGIVSSQIEKAQTIHRLLGLGGRSQPRYHRHAPLPYDLIVIDEGSMLDLALASLLFDAIAVGTRLIILGDANQLAAVDAGAVLSDLGQTESLTDHLVDLLESRRFKSDAGIGLLAKGVLEQNAAAVVKAIDGNSNEVKFYDLAALAKKDVYPALWHSFGDYLRALKHLQTAEHPLSPDVVHDLFRTFDRFRVLCAQRYGDLGAHAINRALGEQLHQSLAGVAAQMPADGWFSGRSVMITRNDYGLRLSNGDIGICLRDGSPSGNGKPWVYFPDRAAPIAASRLPPEQIETAFALTIHKSQGSEFDVVAMVLDPSNTEMLTRELVYTAITRAKQTIQVWSTQHVLLDAITHKGNRVSGLRLQIERQIILRKSAENLTSEG
jgi:exodeoxyribonuclease V alpha subunit